MPLGVKRIYSLDFRLDLDFRFIVLRLDLFFLILECHGFSENLHLFLMVGIDCLELTFEVLDFDFEIGNFLIRNVEFGINILFGALHK